MISSPHLEDVSLTLRWIASRHGVVDGIIISAEDEYLRPFSSSHFHGRPWLGSGLGSVSSAVSSRLTYVRLQDQWNDFSKELSEEWGHTWARTENLIASCLSSNFNCAALFQFCGWVKEVGNWSWWVCCLNCDGVASSWLSDWSQWMANFREIYAKKLIFTLRRWLGIIVQKWLWTYTESETTRKLREKVRASWSSNLEWIGPSALLDKIAAQFLRAVSFANRPSPCLFFSFWLQSQTLEIEPCSYQPLDQKATLCSATCTRNMPKFSDIRCQFQSE